MFAQLWFVLFVFAASLHSSTLVEHSQETHSKNLSDSITVVDHFISQYTTNLSLPSLTIGVAQKGKLIWSKAYGYADLENRVPAKTTTRYRLASISKSFTASLIGTLVDRGLMSFGDLLSVHLSHFPQKYWDNQPVNITIGQLLSHTAGVYNDRNEDDEVYFWNVILAHNITECIQRHKNKPLNFKPGTKFAYCNYGYLLLGAVVESVTKKSYQVAMSELLAEHGLNSTLVETLESIVPDRARSYRVLNETNKLIPARLIDDLYVAMAEWSDGSLMSNVGDMLKFAQLWIDSFKGRKTVGQTKQFLSRETARQMWTPHTRGLKGVEDEFESKYVQYGYGWAISNNSMWHDGSLDGVATLLTIYPEKEMAVVALCNQGGADGLKEMTEFAVKHFIDLCN